MIISKYFQLFTLRIFALLFLVISHSAIGQLIVNNAVNATDGVQNVLLGPGVVASNITFIGNNDQIASFNCSTCNLGLQSGLVMSTGNANGASGPNNSGSTTSAYGSGYYDADLDAISAVSINDAAILQFDFVPEGSNLIFNFVFGSDEYPEFTNDIFNDSFGFFMSGPGLSGPFQNQAVNIALIPNTNIPVSINNLNNGYFGTSGPCEYCSYYNHNGDGFSSPYSSSSNYIQADGFTTVLQAKAVVQCGQTYHIKLALADGGDPSWDSWVFLEAGSFASTEIVMQAAYIAPNLSPGTDMVYEGCEPAYLTFTRPASEVGSATYAVNISGTATNGVDYTSIGSTLFFGPNQQVATIPVSTIADNNFEGNETVIVSVSGTTACGEAIGAATYTVSITDLPSLSAVTPDVEINCGQTAVLTPEVSGGIGYYHILWGDGTSSPTYSTSPSGPVSISYQVLDTCGVIPVSGVANITFTVNAPIQLNIGPDLAIACMDTVNLYSPVTGGFGPYFYEWSNNGTLISTDTSLSYVPSSPGTIQLKVIDACGIEKTDEMSYSFPPVPVIVNIGPDLSLLCMQDTVIQSQVQGGIGNYTYSWSNQGNILGTSDQLSYVANGSQMLKLTVTDQCGNIGTDQLATTVPPIPVLVDLGPDLTVNCLEETELTAQVQGGSGVYTYLWMEQNLVLGNTDTYTYQAHVVGNTDIALIATDQCGNVGNDVVTIQVPSAAITIDLGPDQSVTCLDVVSLDGVISGGVGNYSYTWSVDGLGASGEPTYDAQVDENTAIMLTVLDECGNIGSDNLMILVPPVPVLVDAGPDVTIGCLDTTLLQGQASGGVGNLSYSWTDGNTILSITSTASYHTFHTMPVTLTVEDECGNTGNDIVQVIIPPTPIDIIITPDTAICFGESVQLEASASGGVGELEHEWQPVNSQYNSINPSPAETTVYTYSASDVCGNTASESVVVTVEIVEPGFTVEYVGNTGVQLTNHSSGAVSYVWTFEDGTLAFTEDLFVPLLLTGPVHITLTAIGALGCEKSYSDLFYPLADIYVPNTFTPNGDGINDFFFAEGHDLRQFEMSIFNRWGDRVFHTEDIDIPWDGSQQGGLYYVPDGVYNYRVTAVGIRGNVIEKTGFVQMLR